MENPGAGVHGLAQLAHQADVAHLLEPSDVVGPTELGLLEAALDHTAEITYVERLSDEATAAGDRE